MREQSRAAKNIRVWSKPRGNGDGESSNLAQRPTFVIEYGLLMRCLESGKVLMTLRDPVKQDG
jgi:hypothetical protein